MAWGVGRGAWGGGGARAGAEERRASSHTAPIRCTAILVFLGHDIAGRRVAAAKLDETAIVFAEHALGLELVEFRQPLGHPRLHCSKVLRVGRDGRDSQQERNREKEKTVK